jgi:general stress protein YciG
MQGEQSGGTEGSKHPDEDDNEAPETPLDEPRPPRIEDPPRQPDPRHPYVVTHRNKAPAAPRGTAQSAGDRARASGSLEPRVPGARPRRPGEMQGSPSSGKWRHRVNTGERKERRGFASMSAEKQREIASKGGRAAHEKGTAHEWSADEARTAGRKGGQVSRGGRGRLIVPSETAPTPQQ